MVKRPHLLLDKPPGYLGGSCPLGLWHSHQGLHTPRVADDRMSARWIWGGGNELLTHIMFVSCHVLV